VETSTLLSYLIHPSTNHHATPWFTRLPSQLELINGPSWTPSKPEKPHYQWTSPSSDKSV
uniref:Uncharacterized protein n=1 Tax=Oryza brachyantha TaxID=4533 RepID=J3M623_ORYBR